MQTLPPTSAAAKYHSLRVYYQVMEWKGAGDSIKPEEWGWRIVEGNYLPVNIDKPPAPSHLLDMICCGCNKHCNTNRCTSRRRGLCCSDVCTECRGVSCSNSELPNLTEDCLVKLDLLTSRGKKIN